MAFALSATTASNDNFPLLFTHHDKTAFVILLATGVAARTAGVWDNSYPTTVAIGALLGATYGVYVTITNKRPNDFNLKDAAMATGALGIGISLIYSISVETAFQSLALIGSVVTNQ